MSIVLASELISRVGITSVTDAEKASKTKIQKNLQKFYRIKIKNTK